MIIGLLTANLICLVNTIVKAEADETLQSTGQIIITNPNTGDEEIIFDAKDQ